VQKPLKGKPYEVRIPREIPRDFPRDLKIRAHASRGRYFVI